jgi:hypothetical protein
MNLAKNRIAFDRLKSPSSNNAAVRYWDKFSAFGALYFAHETFRTNTLFSTYYILVKRGNIMVTNTQAIRDLFCRIYNFFKLQPECLRWVVTQHPQYFGLARWFGWETGSDVYVQLDRGTVAFWTNGCFYSVRSRFIAYKFLYFIGCDVAFVFSSYRDDGHYLDFKNHGIPTIGFDDGEVLSYTYGLPGGTASVSTVLIYSRILTLLLADISRSSLFWNLRANRLII